MAPFIIVNKLKEMSVHTYRNVFKALDRCFRDSFVIYAVVSCADMGLFGTTIIETLGLVASYI